MCRSLPDKCFISLCTKQTPQLSQFLLHTWPWTWLSRPCLSRICSSHLWRSLISLHTCDSLVHKVIWMVCTAWMVTPVLLRRNGSPHNSFYSWGNWGSGRKSPSEVPQLGVSLGLLASALPNHLAFIPWITSVYMFVLLYGTLHCNFLFTCQGFGLSSWNSEIRSYLIYFVHTLLPHRNCFKFVEVHRGAEAFAQVLPHTAARKQKSSQAWCVTFM